jgi:hypothetical protein
MDPLLMSIQDLVRTRDENVSYQTENVLLIKSIFEQLKRYQQDSFT